MARYLLHGKQGARDSAAHHILTEQHRFMEAKDLRQPAVLQQAFAEFEQASLRLGSFYGDLEQRVGELTRELSSSRAEQLHQLNEKERLASRLASLLEALPGGVVVLDAGGCIQEHNPAAADLLGPIASGEPWIDVVMRAFSPKWDDGHDISLKDGRVVNIATQALTGEPGQILLIKDVSETRRLQEQLSHHRRLSATTEMAAALAHQIRTPLASALLHTSNLNRRSLPDDARARAAGNTLDALRRMERLVEQMLLFARGGNTQLRPLLGSELIRRFRQLAEEAVRGSDFRVDIDASIGDATIRANEDSLLSIMLNLVHNSRQATNDSGRLLVDARCDGDVLALKFSDDGPGIPRALHEQVFEPFYTTRRGGTGLGLAVARSVARAHDGNLYSDPDFEPGTCLVLELPLMDQRTAPGQDVWPIREMHRSRVVGERLGQ